MIFSFPSLLQIEDITDEMCKDIINKFEPVEECKSAARIGMDGTFLDLLH